MVSYKKGSSSLNYGRWFADKAQSIQNMPRLIRYSICRNIWIDLDDVNCHPVILEHLCNYYNINCYYFSKYNKIEHYF